VPGNIGSVRTGFPAPAGLPEGGMPTLSIGDCIQFGWDTFKTRPWILIGGFLLAMLIPSIPSIFFPGPEVVPGQPLPPFTTGQLIASLVGFVLSIFTTLGATTFVLRAHDNIAGVQIGDLWNPQPFWRFLGAEILLFVIILIGLFLFVVPGVIAGLGFGFCTYLVIERGLGPIESLKESWHITYGHKWRLLLLALVIIGINILGALALLVGLLVSVPVSWLAFTHAYRTLASQAEGPEPALNMSGRRSPE
jgi:hypothetical protein